MSKKSENTGFICTHCGKAVAPLTNGSYRNHCPHCLYSLHVDDSPGDRANTCMGLMKPVEVRLHSKNWFQIVHRCEKCSVEKRNRAATDTVMPDDFDRILAILKNGRNQ